jgi:hypothetical protein
MTLRRLMILGLLWPLAISMFLDAAWLFYSIRAGSWLAPMPTEPWAYLNPIYGAAAYLIWRFGEPAGSEAGAEAPEPRATARPERERGLRAHRSGIAAGDRT